ncbi:MAG: hypothetical protein ACR2PL_12195 [Dehalococcoidia bacterium]
MRPAQLVAGVGAGHPKARALARTTGYEDIAGWGAKNKATRVEMKRRGEA